ncbi:equilibrative nucleoside transporter 3-like [Plakobranchus ocellatus]|uniref:Equilibrative nucleoside transporter 3-like n=1 Tax=Plakobranchus ocellatus TaxID=259542 RepID=A0AAV3YDI6_9GAST|nr:equilibrative nucleoside transporter 3-like [Plakobranchus ocellatus]
MDGGGDEDMKHVRLTRFDKRDPMSSLDGPSDGSIWHQSPLFKNGAYEPSTNSEREHFLPPVKLDPGWDGMANSAPIHRSSTEQLIAEMERNTPNDRGKLGVRIVTSIFIMIIMFVFTVILAMMDTSEWPELFFWITIASAVIINAAVGMYQNSMYGLVAVLPMKYTNAVILGNNISGTLVAVTNIIVLVLSPDKKTSAIYYFVVAILILMIAFDAYFLTGHSRFYRHHVELSKLKKKEIQEKAIHQDPLLKVLGKSFGRVMKKIWHLAFGVFFTFFITLVLFPAVVSDVKPLQIKMHDDYWTAVFCFLFFNFFATLGNFATEFVRWPNSRWVNVLVILRVVFVPLMVLGNFRPELRNLPVYFNHDAIFIGSVILFAFSSGYCSSLLMMYAPKCVSLHDAPIAGMIMALFLVLGILAGINCSRVWGYAIKAG